MYREELPFFEDPDYQRGKLPQFLQLFDRGSGRKAVGFKRPSYLAKAECPGRLHDHFPDAKLIAVLRNPVERAVSAYFHYMQNGFIPIAPLNEGMQSLIDGVYAKQHPAGRDILEYGFYAKQLRRYLAEFSSEQLLVVLYDDISIAPEKTLGQVHRYLGVAEDYQLRSVTAKPMASIKSPARLRINLVLRKLWATHNGDRTRVYHRDSRISRGVRIGANGFDRYILATLFPNDEVQLNSTIRQQLVKIYEHDVHELGIVIQRRLSHWLN